MTHKTTVTSSSSSWSSSSNYADSMDSLDFLSLLSLSIARSLTLSLLSLSLSLSIALSLSLALSLLAIFLGMSSRLPPVSVHVSLCSSANPDVSICRCPRKNFACEFVPASPAVLSMSFSSNLWDGRLVAIQLPFCGVLLQGFVQNSMQHSCVAFPPSVSF